MTVPRDDREHDSCSDRDVSVRPLHDDTGTTSAEVDVITVAVTYCE